VLDHHSWVHPYDQDGRRRDFSKFTKSIDKLRDDPFRAGLVRPGRLMTSKQAAKARGTSRRLAVC
jgi:hypothetical protein